MLTEKDVTYRVNHSQAIAVITVADQCPKFNDHLRVLRAKLVVDRSVTGWAGHEAIQCCKQNFDACDLGLEEHVVYSRYWLVQGWHQHSFRTMEPGQCGVVL